MKTETPISAYFDQIYGDYKTAEDIRAERMINMIRLLALLVLYADTSVNYYIRHVVSSEIHYGVSAVSALWLVATVLTWLITREDAPLPGRYRE